MTTWDNIKTQVEDNDNVVTVSMNELKDAAGKDRLGTHVRREISKTLAGMGLGHIPSEIPSYQHDSIRLYKRGTPAGDLIEMVISPGETNDRKLREQLSGSKIDHADLIEKIRELISE